MSELSIVIPAHNEGEHLERFVEDFLRRLSPATRDNMRETIIVENGSTDDTWEACERLRSGHPDIVRVFRNARGSYGEAIKRGMLESQGSQIAILECDFLDAAFIGKSQELYRTDKAMFTVASKRHPASEDNRPYRRRILTLGFNLVLRIACGYPGSDTHGLKFIDAALARRLCQIAQTTDEVFQTEIVLLAWRLGTTIHELPIYIAESRHHRVPILKRIPKIMNMVWHLRRSLRRFPGVVAKVERH